MTPRPAGRPRLLAAVPVLVLLAVVVALVLGARASVAADGMAPPVAARGHDAHADPVGGFGRDGVVAADPAIPTALPTPEPTEPPAADPEERTAVVVPPGLSPDHPAGRAPGTSLAQAAGTPDGGERDGAAGLGDPRAPIDPSEVIDGSTSLGGCHPAYGSTSQCLPLVPPSMSAHVADMVAAGIDVTSMPHPWTCAELLTYFPDGVAVRRLSDPAARDPFGLDLDGDLVACREADR